VDIASIVGLFMGASMLIVGMGFDFNKMVFEASKLNGFWDPPSVAIVIFGSLLGSMMIAQNLKQWVTAIKAGKLIFSLGNSAAGPLIKQLVGFAETARRDGILALENVTDDIEDDYLVRGIRLAVDGTDPELIEGIMETELEILELRHNDVIAFWNLVGKYAPVWGMLGTLIGLILMLADMRPETIGPNMSIALLTTYYGAIVANYIAIPIADKLKSKHAQEGLIKNIILKGVMSIQSGDNPRIVQQKLNIYLPPKEREYD
jgi:chemotaxis protein MotA